MILIKYDKPLVGVLYFIAVGPLPEIFTQIMKHFRLTNLSASKGLSLLLLKSPNLLLGILVIMGFGTWAGLFTYYGLKILGKDYLPVKGMFITMSLESWVFNVFGNLVGNEKLILSVSGNFVYAAASAIGGLSGGFIIQKFLFKNTGFQKGGSMKYDKPLLAMLFGFTPLPVLEGFTQIMKHLGLTSLSVFEALSLMWLRKPSWVLGILAMLGIGSWIGLIIYQSGKILGVDYFPIKAMLIELTSVFLIFSIFGTIGRNELIIQSVSGFFVHAFAAAIGGLSTGFLIKKYLFGLDVRYGSGPPNEKIKPQ
jgi:hypothetical protein